MMSLYNIKILQHYTIIQYSIYKMLFKCKRNALFLSKSMNCYYVQLYQNIYFTYDYSTTFSNREKGGY